MVPVFAAPVSAASAARFLGGLPPLLPSRFLTEFWTFGEIAIQANSASPPSAAASGSSPRATAHSASSICAFSSTDMRGKNPPSSKRT